MKLLVLLLTQFLKGHVPSSSTTPNSPPHLQVTRTKRKEDNFLPKQESKVPHVSEREAALEITQPHLSAHFTGEETEAQRGQRGAPRSRCMPVEGLSPEPQKFTFELPQLQRRGFPEHAWVSQHVPLHVIWCQVVTSPPPDFLTAFGSKGFTCQEQRSGFPTKTADLPFAAPPQNPNSDTPIIISPVTRAGVHSIYHPCALLCQLPEGRNWVFPAT